VKIGWFLTTKGPLGGVRSSIETGNALIRQGHDFYLLGNVGKHKASFCEDNIPSKNNIPFNIYDKEENIERFLRSIDGFDLLFNQDPVTMSFSKYTKSKVHVMHYCCANGACYEQFADLDMARTSCSKDLYEVSKKHDKENKYKKKFISQGVNFKEFYPKDVNSSIYKKFRNTSKINILCCGSRGGARRSNKGTYDIIEATKFLDQDKYNFIYFDLTKQDFPENFSCIPTIGNQNTLADVYSICDIYIAPDYVSAFNCCMSEAMSCKKPVICSTPGVADFAKNNENCLIYQEGEENSPRILADKIELLANNEKLRNELAQNGYETIQNFSWDNVANNIVEFSKEFNL